MRGRGLRGACWALLVGGAVVAAGVPSPTRAQETLRVVAYNIKHGLGMDGQVDLARVARVLGALDADVITLQEVDDGAERTHGVDQARVVGDLLGMRAFHGPFRDFQGGRYGMAVLTRLPVLHVENHAIPPGPEGALSVLEVRVGLGRRAISVVGIHFYRSPEERLVQADSVTSYFGETEHPVVLAGDFNSRRGDLVLRRLREDWLVLPKDGPPETFPADAPDREIDFVMVRPAEGFEVVEHRVVDEPVASDHRPLLAVLRLW